MAITLIGQTMVAAQSLVEVGSNNEQERAQTLLQCMEGGTVQSLEPALKQKTAMKMAVVKVRIT